MCHSRFCLTSSGTLTHPHTVSQMILSWHVFWCPLFPAPHFPTLSLSPFHSAPSLSSHLFSFTYFYLQPLLWQVLNMVLNRTPTRQNMYRQKEKIASLRFEALGPTSSPLLLFSQSVHPAFFNTCGFLASPSLL